MIDTAPMNDIRYEIIARPWHKRTMTFSTEYANSLKKSKRTMPWGEWMAIIDDEDKNKYTFKKEIDKILELEGSENNV
jgi:hypothetical protein